MSLYGYTFILSAKLYTQNLLYKHNTFNTSSSYIISNNLAAPSLCCDEQFSLHSSSGL